MPVVSLSSCLFTYYICRFHIFHSFERDWEFDSHNSRAPLMITGSTKRPPGESLMLNLTNLDGVSIWESLSANSKSPREEILHNIDDDYGNAALTIGKWKLVKGDSYNNTWAGWYGPSGRTGTYNTSALENSPVNIALKSLGKDIPLDKILALREGSTIVCHNITSNADCKPLEAPCLFDIDSDPCEIRNLASEYPDIVSSLISRLDELNATAIPPGNLPIDPAGDPKYWNYVFSNFGDCRNHGNHGLICYMLNIFVGMSPLIKYITSCI